MAMFVAPELGLADLARSLPMPAGGSRDPYAGFGYLRRLDSVAKGVRGYEGHAWLRALEAQFAPNQIRQDLEGFERDRAFTRMFDTELGHAAVQIIGNEERTLGQISSLAAETLAAAMLLLPLADGHQRDFWTDEDARTLVLPGTTDGDLSPTLVVLEQDGPPVAQRVTDRIVIAPGPLMDAQKRLRDGAPRPGDEAKLEDMVFGMGPDGLLTLLWIARPEVIVAQRPLMVPLSCPSPALEVRCGAERSSVGMFCRDAGGVAGFTACFHGTGPVGTSITLGGNQTVVTQANSVQDLVFAPLPPDYVVPNFANGSKGIRRNRAPGQDDPATFEGCTSGAKTTAVVSHDAGLLRTRATIQLKLQTTAAVNHGDSGSALIDEHDQIMAFAFERTDIDASIQFADWIWAANAFDALGLQPL